MNINKRTLRNVFLGIGGCIVLYWLLFETNQVSAVLGTIVGILSPFIVGAAMAFVLNVPMRGIEGWLKKVKKPGLRRGLAICLTFVAIVLVLYGVVVLLIPQIGATVESIGNALPGFFERVQNNIKGYLKDNPQLLEWLSSNTNIESMNWSELLQKAVTFFTSRIGNFVDTAVSTAINLGTGIFNAVMSVVFALYCLARKETLSRQGRRLLYSFLPERFCDGLIRILRMTNSTFSRFISGQCLEALILGAMFAITMPIFGMPYAPLISVIIAVLSLVPIVGAFIGCIIGAFFILMENPVLAFWFVVLFLVLQQIEGNLIYPRVVGTSIGLPGMWVLLAVVVGGDLMGIGGMLVMIPLASVAYSLMREITAKRLEKRNIPRDKLMDQPPDLKRRRIKKKKAKEQISAEEKTED